MRLMAFKNLSKTFKYVNEMGDSLVFEYDKGFLINKPEGIDSVSISLSRAKGINQVGETVQSKNVQSRPINVSGIIVGSFQEENKERLLSVIRPDLKARFYAGDYYLDVSPTATPKIESKAKFAHFNFSMLAAYPYWQHDENLKVVLSGLNYKFKYPINISKPYKFAESIETQFFNVKNSGQLPVPFRVTFYSKGECENPKIINVETAKFLEIKKAMSAGERIVVNITHNRTDVLSSIDGDISGALTLESNLFTLNVGDNILKPEAISGKKQLEVNINFATEKVGVSL